MSDRDLTEAELQPQKALLLFSLGCARLVHNTHREEDPMIDELLHGSLELYTELEDHTGKAKVLNARCMHACMHAVVT